MHEVPEASTQKGSLGSALELLGALAGGKATIALQGRTVFKVDADEKTLEVDAGGVKQAGLNLSDLARAEGGPLSMLTGPVRIAGALSEQGWGMILRVEGDVVLKMGKGTPRLTGRISFSPLKTRKLLKALR